MIKHYSKEYKVFKDELTPRLAILKGVVVSISMFLFDSIGYGVPFILAGGMYLAVFLWGFFVVKEIPALKVYGFEKYSG